MGKKELAVDRSHGAVGKIWSFIGILLFQVVQDVCSSVSAVSCIVVADTFTSAHLWPPERQAVRTVRKGYVQRHQLRHPGILDLHRVRDLLPSLPLDI